MYYNQKMSGSMIAKEIHVSKSLIYKFMEKNNIRARDYATASSFMNNRKIIEFSPKQEQLILGGMLGDACLYQGKMKSNKTGKILNTISLRFFHSIKQIEYLNHKKEVIGGSKIMTKKSGYGSIIKYFAFCHTPSLQKYVDICLLNKKKKITQEWVDCVDIEGIAYWYMDDGCLAIRKNGYIYIKFFTNSFSDEELTLLQKLLLKFGLQTKRAKPPKKQISKNNRYILISCHKNETISFLKRLEPHIVDCMKYKIRCLYGEQFVPVQSLQTHTQGI
jgi:hypothetical protein